MMMLKKLEGINIEVLKELSETHEELNYSKLCEKLNIKKYGSMLITRFVRTMAITGNLRLLGRLALLLFLVTNQKC